jgi:hypothetical protein
MIKTAISIVIIGLVLWGGYAVWQKWDTYSTNKDQEQKQAEQAVVNGDSLPGMPPALADSFKKATAKGDATTLRNWLKLYGQQVDDPRRAWIELDYMVMISTTDPQEAKKIFADVKGRSPDDSPIQPRLKMLAKTYE